MTKKHFKAIADIIKDSQWSDNPRYKQTLDKNTLINDLCVVFSAINPRFNKSKFVDACE